MDYRDAALEEAIQQIAVILGSRLLSKYIGKRHPPRYTGVPQSKSRILEPQGNLSSVRVRREGAWIAQSANA